MKGQSMMSKWLTAAVYVSAVICTFIYRYDILAWLRGDHNPALVIGAATLLALIPVLPYKLVIGVFGYSLGAAGGALTSWTATTLAAALMYGLVKHLARNKARAYLATVPALDKFTAAVERQPFAAVVLARLAPVIPQAAVNVYAGAAGLPFWSYLAATSLGKIPGIALYAFLGEELLRRPQHAVIAVLVYAAVLFTAGWSVKYSRSRNKSV
ncbi:TVP38/TMEM64 family protein [Paenibacillus tengchongensis]|uniref:TVP38/TMEM64 family protein n=1 Tax=Paenibacillus tengchongensis TaxID=2608684 RepID=UPI001FECDBD3|nr:VTT domain-containing protein [Paenibacillus tengchongensis]